MTLSSSELMSSLISLASTSKIIIFRSTLLFSVVCCIVLHMTVTRPVTELGLLGVSLDTVETFLISLSLLVAEDSMIRVLLES